MIKSLSLGVAALFSVFVGISNADSIAWEPRRGSLDKADFSTAPAVYRVMSQDGVDLTFKLTHLGTSPGLFTYSEWNIERWGDPEGLLTAPGSWQSVGNGLNDVSLDFWGYWGNGGSPLTPGATTSYAVEIEFDRPVNDLSFQINAINALLTADGNHAFDTLTVSSYLESVQRPSPNYTNAGDGFIRTGDVLVGDFDNPIGGDTGNISFSDEGSIQVSFDHLVDRIRFTYVCEAQHPTPSSFADTVQNWSFSIGDLSFEPEAAMNRSALAWESRRGSVVKPGFDSEYGDFATASDDGAVNVEFTLEGMGTTGDKFSYSQWEVDRWGDPTGIVTNPPGSWQVSSNGFNDVVLGIWGYWGTDGDPQSPPMEIGDQTSYRLTMRFDKPVSDLRFQTHAINALVGNGFNAFDRVTVVSRLGGVVQPEAIFTNEGPGFTRSGNVLTGDLNFQIGGGFQNVTDEGSTNVRFVEALDEVELIYVSEAAHPDPALFQGGTQNWGFSIGDLSFVPGVATEIVWAPRQGQLSKPGFNNEPATYQATSVDGGVTATFEISHIATAGDRLGYSQWEIDRWGDPEGISMPTGSWQVVTNATNDVGLALWGYWGGDVPLAIGDQTSYELVMNFDQPVSNLSFSLIGLNALIKEIGGYNSYDILTLTSFLDSTPLGSPVYTKAGNAFTRVGDVFTGDFNNLMSGVYGGQHVSDAGAVTVRFTESVNEVRFTLVNEASHPTPNEFSPGWQTWSFSIGDLSFEYDGSGGGAQQQRTTFAPSFAMPSAARQPLGLSTTPEGDFSLSLRDALPIGGPWFVESSVDLVHWERWSSPAPVDSESRWLIRKDNLGGSSQRYFRLAPAGLD